jgi:hypothetical protein
MVLMSSQMFRDAIDAIAGAIKKESGTVAVNYNEAVKFAYQESRELRKYLGCYDVTDIKQIDKNLKALWSLTYWILDENEKPKVRTICRDPDILLVS